MRQHALDEWVGRKSVDEDILSERVVDSFRDTLDPYLAPVDTGSALLGSHWCLFPTRKPMQGLGEDGHPARYPHLPPSPLPRRMWAGGRLEFIGPLRINDRVTRITTILDIRKKRGRSGELWFFNLDHEFSTQRGIAIRERQDIIYRA